MTSACGVIHLNKMEGYSSLPLITRLLPVFLMSENGALRLAEGFDTCAAR